jgi:DMSO reductase anchor subunit
LAAISLAASTAHLGRPAFAWRALRALKTSWLSREVLMLSVFAGIASAYAGLLLLGSGDRMLLGLATAVSGFAGVFCSARIYVVLARPAWNSPFTISDFFATAFLLGPLLLRPFGFSASHGLANAAIAGAVVQLMVQVAKLGWLAFSDVYELQASSLLLRNHFRGVLAARLALLIIGGVILPMASTLEWTAIAALTLALAGEFIGRWLFFVTVVPKNMGAAFILGARH